MKELMRKKTILLLVLAVVLCACSIETSGSATVSTTVNGQTTTTTASASASTEDGISASSETFTTSEDDPTGLRSKWTELFSCGAEGKSPEGEIVFMAMDDPEDITYAAIMVLDEEMTELRDYILGSVLIDEEGVPYIEDVEGEELLPFTITDTEVEDGFEMQFRVGSPITMYFVDQETIIDDMISIWESVQANQ